MRRCLLTVLALATALLGACASDPPLVPPTELTPLDATIAVAARWQRGVGDAKGQAFKPALDGDLLVAAAANGQVTAIDAASGKQRWSTVVADSLAAGVTLTDTLVIVADHDGVVIALAREDGAEQWRSPMSSEVLAPAGYSQGHVVVRSTDGRVVSLDPATGATRWSASYTPPALTLKGNSAPLVLSSGVLVGLDDGRLLAISLDTGATLWESVLSIPSGRSEVERLVDIDGPIRIDDTAIYAANYQGSLARIEPARGQILWSTPVSSSRGLTLFADSLAVVDEEDVIIAFSKETGRELWRQDALRGRRLTTPQTHAGHLVVGDFEGWIHWLDPRDGTLLARRQLDDSPLLSEPLVVDDVLYMQSADGRLAALTSGR